MPGCTIHAIEPVRDIASRFGGSHAQRDLLTLIEASMRAGDQRRARHYIAERNHALRGRCES